MAISFVPIESVDDDMAEVLRQKTPAERLAIAHGMWRSAAAAIQSVIRSEHPNWSDDEVQRQAARRLSHGAV